MKKYRKNLFTGIMSIIPLAITYWIIENLFIFFSKPGKYLIDKLYSIDLFDQFTFVLKFSTLDFASESTLSPNSPNCFSV